MAREFGIAFTPHTWSNGFGVVANTHLTAGLGEAPFIEFPCDPPEWSLERRDYLLAEPFDQRDGWLQLSEAPGFGVTLDEARLGAPQAGWTGTEIEVPEQEGRAAGRER